MAISNIPTITRSAYDSSTYDGIGTAMGSTGGMGLVSTTDTTRLSNPIWIAPRPEFIGDCSSDHFDSQKEKYSTLMAAALAEQNQEKKVAKSTRRLVKVIIVDTDENVPLDKCVLYSGTEKLTDATDQELFFEIDIKNILDKHNEYRITLKDKSVKERVENLEPVKIRDLRMAVVNVATF